MSRVDEMFAEIVARAKAAAEPAGPPSRGRSGRDATGLDTPTGIACEVCPTGWAAVRLFDVDHTEGRLACPRCAERARMRAATYRILGPVVYYPLTDAEAGR